ncbi:MAG: type II toxin-antitoxin system Phd/YefM family antitoxin, partial [Blastocatellia bacterium]
MTRSAKKPLPRLALPSPSGRKTVRRSWQLQTAKARLSEVFELARTEGPQLITRHGKDGVVMLPVERFDQLVVRALQPDSL